MVLAHDLPSCITASGRMLADEALHLDDMVILPPDSPIESLLSDVDSCVRDPRFHGLFAAHPLLANEASSPTARTSLPHFMALRSEYLTHDADTPPAFAHLLPWALRAHLARSAVLHGSHFHSCGRLPRTGVEYVVAHGGLVEECVDVFGLRRLAGVHQMGFMHDQAAGDQTRTLHQSGPFTHTRYDHVMNVMAIATLLAHNCNLSSHERVHLRVAALTHDALTPAGGDTTKEMDPEGLCEDRHYRELFDRHDCSSFLARHNLDRALLVDTILGRGVLGHLLNVADKCAYTARDVDVYLERCMTHMKPDFAAHIRALADCVPLVCGVWDVFRVIADWRGTKHVVCLDAERLYHFLHLRAYMFRYVYYETDARSREFVLARVALSHLYRAGVISRDDLLRMTDAELLSAIERAVGHLPFYRSSERVMRAFCTREEAEAFRAALLTDGCALAFIYEVPRISSGDNFQVLSSETGDRVSFADWMPTHAAHVRAVVHHSEPYRVYGIR